MVIICLMKCPPDVTSDISLSVPVANDKNEPINSFVFDDSTVNVVRYVAEVWLSSTALDQLYSPTAVVNKRNLGLYHRKKSIRCTAAQKITTYYNIYKKIALVDLPSLYTVNKKLIRRWDSERELSLRRHCTRTRKYNRHLHNFRQRSDRQTTDRRQTDGRRHIAKRSRSLKMDQNWYTRSNMIGLQHIKKIFEYTDSSWVRTSQNF